MPALLAHVLHVRLELRHPLAQGADGRSERADGDHDRAQDRPGDADDLAVGGRREHQGSRTRTKRMFASEARRERRCTWPPLEFEPPPVLPSMHWKEKAVPLSKIPMWSNSPSRPQSKQTRSPGCGLEVMRSPWRP